MDEPAEVDLRAIGDAHGVGEPADDDLGDAHLRHLRLAGESELDPDDLLAPRLSQLDERGLDRIGIVEVGLVRVGEAGRVGAPGLRAVEPLRQLLDFRGRQSHRVPPER